MKLLESWEDSLHVLSCHGFQLSTDSPIHIRSNDPLGPRHRSKNLLLKIIQLICKHFPAKGDWSLIRSRSEKKTRKILTQIALDPGIPCKSPRYANFLNIIRISSEV